MPLITGGRDYGAQCENARWIIAVIIGSGVVIRGAGVADLQIWRSRSRCTLGRIGINIATRIMGLLVAAVAVRSLSWMD